MDKCKPKKIWCGKSPKVPDGYSKRGRTYECLRAGFGAGSQTEKLNHLPSGSLQRISYIGDRYETRFIQHGIISLASLMKEMRKLTATGKGQLLRKILKKSDGSSDQRSFNSVVLFLYQKGVKDLPSCKQI